MKVREELKGKRGRQEQHKCQPSGGRSDIYSTVQNEECISFTHNCMYNYTCLFFCTSCVVRSILIIIGKIYKEMQFTASVRVSPY